MSIAYSSLMFTQDRTHLFRGTLPEEVATAVELLFMAHVRSSVVGRTCASCGELGAPESYGTKYRRTSIAFYIHSSGRTLHSDVCVRE